MVLGDTCKICKELPSKYKCPTCTIEYCSLECFKSNSHKHDETLEKREESTKDLSIKVHGDYKDDKDYKEEDEIEKLVKDDKLRYLLKFKALKFHLRAIYDILSDTSLNSDQRWDKANEKLSSLRITGSEENELVEEFCQRVIELQSDP